ncbi:hypothetical protein AVEN_29577-1 [Araneus ventricosus]|uniref:Secreted protein n=1 Tax=Araneus ventricosus TaxID=182803 RepID=A0A4Y2T2C5_ARAVE|nr:hypothetical protein AVEN_29577-1 [Araneus ventricosus]
MAQWRSENSFLILLSLVRACIVVCICARGSHDREFNGSILVPPNRALFYMDRKRSRATRQAPLAPAKKLSLTHIAILVCSKLALQICKLARLTRQECKLETSLQKRQSHHATNLQQACHVKLIANIAKTEYRKKLGLELATYRFQSGRFNHAAR